MPVSFFFIFVTLCYIYNILLGIISKDDEGPNTREFFLYLCYLMLYLYYIIRYHFKGRRGP